MSRSTLSHRPVRAVLALTVGAASLVGLSSASAAPPVAYAVTGVSPAYVEADVDDAFGITLTGKGFTRKTKVTFSKCEGPVTTVAPSTVTATKLVVKPPKCEAGVQDITVSEGSATSTLSGRLTFLATPKVSPGTDDVGAVAPAAGPWSGGTLASLDLVDPLPAKAAVQVLFTSDGVTKAVAGRAVSPKRVSFKVPPGLPGGKPDIAVGVFGILSEPVKGAFTYVSTVRTSPAVWVKGTPAPAVKVDGAGFTKDAVVKICGVDAPLSTTKPATAKSLVVTPPAWSAVEDDVDPDKGGVCAVQVTVGTVVSALTAGSTFTYAAY
jgi:hypothetical protein